MKIETDRLILRPFEFNDDKDLFEMCRDPLTAYNAGWTPHRNIDVTRQVILGYVYGKENFAITLKGSGKVIGTISLYQANLRKNINCRELGFCLNKDFRNHGFITEAVNAILNYGFKKLKLDLIMVCHHRENYPCAHVIKKFPFTYEGTLRMYRTLYDGTIIDGVMYSMKKEEFGGLNL